MTRTARGPISSLFLFLFAAGCGGSEPPAKQPEPPGPIRGESTQMELVPPPHEMSQPPPPEVASPKSSEPPAAEKTPSSSPALADDEILQALHTANSGEIEQAKLAQQRAKSARVKRYAAMMLKDHVDADERGRDAAKRAKVTPAGGDVSRDLESDVKQTTTSLSSEKGADFDRRYLDAQVKEHQAVIDLIDTQLMPNAKSADVKALLQTVRPKVENHLKEAQDLQKNLATR